MGMDFSALMSCGDVAERSDHRLERAAALLSSVEREIDALWKSDGMIYALRKPGWITSDVFPESIDPPDQINEKVSLVLPGAFYLTFGLHGVSVYHPLRFIAFITSDDWRTTMISACELLCEAFDAEEGIVCRDECPAISNFRRGLSYRASIEESIRIGEGPVPNIESLLTTDELGDYWSRGFWKFFG